MPDYPKIIGSYEHQTMGWELKYIDTRGKPRSKYRRKKQSIDAMEARLMNQWASGVEGDDADPFDDVVEGMEIGKEFFLALVGENCRLVAAYPSSDDYRQSLKALTTAARAMESYTKAIGAGDYDGMTDEEIAELIGGDFAAALRAIPKDKQKKLIKFTFEKLKKVA